MKEATTSPIYSRSNLSNDTEDTFSYLNENFDLEAWRKESGLPNNFASSKKRDQTLFSPVKNEVKELNSYSNIALYTSQKDESADSLNAVCQKYKNCPVINLNEYDLTVQVASANKDHCSAQNKNFRQYLRDEIFKWQSAYEHSKMTEKKIYIVIGRVERQ